MAVGTPHVAKFGVGWNYGGGGPQCVNIFYVEDASDAIFADPTAACNAVAAAVASELAPQTRANIVYNQVEFEDVRAVPFGGIVVPTTPTVAGSLAIADNVPSSVAIAVKKSTANLGRTGRGRWYFPLSSSDDLDNGDFCAAARVGDIVAALEAFQAAVEAALAPGSFGIVSYQSGGAPRASGLFQRIVGWGIVDRAVDSQRRRLVGRGR